MSKVVWKSGNYCRAIYSEDACEYEAKILDILADENSNPYANVEFVGYLNQDVIWLEDLMESKGEEARKKQAEECGMDVIDTLDEVDQNKIETTKQPMENLPAVNGGPISLEKKDDVDHMGDNKIAETKPPLEKESVINSLPNSLEKKDEVDHMGDNIAATKTAMEKESVIKGIPNSLEKKDEVDHMGDNIAATKTAMEKESAIKGIPTTLEMKDNAKASEVCVKVGRQAVIEEFNDLKKYITTIEDKICRIVSEYQEKNKALAYELKESKDIAKTHKTCEEILQDANNGLMAKNSKLNEQIKSMEKEMDQFAIYKLQLEKKLNEGIDETDGNNNSQKTEGQKAKNTNADSATAQMGITSQELKNQTVKAMKFVSREILPGVNVGIFSDEFFQEVYQKFLEEVKNENI